MLVRSEMRLASSVLDQYESRFAIACNGCTQVRSFAYRKCPICGSLGFKTFEKTADTKVEIEHPGILEIPDGKTFLSMPVDHFVSLAKHNGPSPIQEILANLIRWMGPGSKNPNPNTSVVQKAKKVQNAIKEKVIEADKG